MNSYRQDSATFALSDYALDVDRVHPVEGLVTGLRRRMEGRYPIDVFGGDPQLQDAIAPVLSTVVRVDVHGGEHLPALGAAVLVANRGLGIVEPAALAVAVRKTVHRRLRIVGAPDVPFVGGLLHKLGGVGFDPGDLAALLRAGHLAAVPLAPTWLRTGAGEPPPTLLTGALGHLVVPVAVRPGGPFNLPLRPWQVFVGEPLEPPAHAEAGDVLAAAELAEQARRAVADLLD